MFNLANRNSCDNFNVKSFKMNNFFKTKEVKIITKI